MVIADHFKDTLVPLGLMLCSWALSMVIVANMVALVGEIFQRARQMHQIPCARCRYFTGEYQLKCTVHPFQALSESAIHCWDFEPEASRNYGRDSSVQP